ncbi:YicC family protein [Candidatus Aerophobetes bacterium]|nr:YicC family protein [Candidatus Aerophobetes bacterium]
MRSMTGYGEKSISREEAEAFVQIKTLNHRFLQVNIICPEDVPWRLEREIEDRVKKEIYRGKVLISLQIIKKGEDFIEIEPNFKLATSYFNVLKKLGKNLNVRENIKLSHLLSIPEIFTVQKRFGKDVENVLQRAVDDALQQVIKSREEEGERHLKEILKYTKKIKSSITYIEKEFPCAQKKYREKVQEEIEKIVSQEESSLLSNQINSRLSLIITKGDITEEVVRFHSHVEVFNKTLSQKGPIGKKLGFILQELQREINTVGAKSLSSGISKQVVQIKDYIEKIREQMYNIE